MPVPPETEAQSPVESMASSVPQASVWQLDFCSRPVVDERGKKKWELMICDENRSFEFARFFTNNQINSAQLKIVLAEILSQPGARRPDSVKFFRGQMQTIITRALNELDIKPVPSRRCFTLINWLRERAETVYKQMPGFSTSVAGPLAMDAGGPRDLPEALMGESWELVQYPLSDLQNELQQVDQGLIFGEKFDLAAIGAADLPSDALVPGIAVFSRRCEALAAWTSGVELAAVVADADRACLILEAGVNERFRYGSYRRTPEATAEARAWEEAKQKVRGLHFLAIMENEDAEESTGIWLLQEQSTVPV